MLKNSYRYMFVLLCIIQTVTYAQTRLPFDPHETSDLCSRMVPAKKYGIAVPNRLFTTKDGYNKSVARTTATCPNGAVGWASLTPSALVSELKQGGSDCFGSFFDIEPNYAPTIFSNSNIYAVASAMYNLSVSYDGTNSSGLYGLVYYLHAAIYQDFNNPGVTMDANATNEYILACESFTSNSGLFTLTEEALDILDEYLILLDFDGLRQKAGVLSVMQRVLRDLAVNKTWKQVPSTSLLTYARTYNRVFFFMFRGMQDNAYINAVDGDNTYFNLAYQVAVDIELQNNEELAFMSVNAASEMARMMESPLLVDDVESYLAQIAQNSQRLSVSWLKAIEAINKYGHCANYNLCENMDQVKEELNNTLFPNTYSFDDGKMVVRSPLSLEKVQALYHASLQVKNQFFRLIQTDEPVAGDTNDTLHMVVFGSKQAYIDYATYLYGIATNNGGMYIENGSTFYTWDRTVGVESSLSLEALFRHEYTHYLQGRYLIPGMWGGSEIYNNSRLVWYEEGMAEFFAGSTDTAGVKLLASNVGVVASDVNAWPSLSTVFNSSYTSGNYNHYHYGNMIWYNWYLNDFAKLKTFFDLTRNNDVTGFDNLVNNLRSSGQTAFTNFLTDVANGTVPGWDPETQWLDDDYLAMGSVSDVKAEFINSTGMSNVSASTEATTLNRRFRITGTLSGQGNASNNADAAKKIGTALDNLLVQLRSNELLNNFSYTIGYFKNVSFNSGIPSADFVITGPLKDANIPDTPVPDFVAENTAVITGGSISFENKSSGYITSLQWSFPGASPSGVTDQISPTVSYSSPGTYDVTLTASGSSSSESLTKPGYIKVYAKNSTNYCIASGNRSDNYVTQLAFGTINNSSGHQPYSDFTSMVTELTPGTSETLQIGTKSSYWTSNAIGAWIDWNADGDFDDAGEQVYSQFGEGPYTTQVNVPSNATVGVTRLRIRVAYGAPESIVACGEDTYIGEVEDYSVAIIGDSNPITYCSSSASRSSYEHIANVQVGSFSHPSGATNYSDFTSQVVNISKGSNSLTLTPGFSGSTYNEYFRVWLDYNRDGDFDDSGELAFDAGAASSVAVSGTINVPASALEGATRMRVSMKYLSAPSSCGTIGDGEVEDYTANIGAGTVGVNAPSSLSATAFSGAITLAWTDNADNEDAFEIERSSGNSSFALVGTTGANVTSYTDNGLNPGTTYTYRVRAKSGATYSAYSNSSSATTPAVTYCAADGNGNPSGQYIKEVQIGTLDNTSTYVSGGYSDYTNMNADVSSSATLTVTPQSTWAGTQARAWVDWNRDGDFDDAGEEVLNAAGSGGSYSTTVYVPSDVASGLVRMRVRVAYNDTPVPCGSIYFSEVEDYSLNIGSAAGPSASVFVREFTIFPNPSKNSQFKLIYPRYEGELEVSVYSLQGAMVYHEVIAEGAMYAGSAMIKLNQNVRGTYLVKITTGKDMVVKKICFE